MFIVLTILPLFSASAKDLRFAVVPKFYGVFFDQSKKGCKDAASQIEGVECVYLGPEKASVRIQDKIIEQLIDEGIDGIAVAVTQSKFLAENSLQKAKQAGIPVITYDSDFNDLTLEKYKNLRLAYIGTNNFELGMALGEQLKTLRPNGGTLIIQSGRPDSPNLNLRMMGIRSALSGKRYARPPGKLLINDHGWTEVREPFFNFDQLTRAVKQMESVLKGRPIQADSFIAVGGWSQNDEALYRKMMVPYKGKLNRKELVIVMSDASPSQLVMLRDHLAHANVGQSPYEMGRQAILTLLKIVKKQRYEEVIHTPLNFCTPDNYDTCTKSL
ncbi:substrate-binding domain-containing protein [Shewanella psychropiezotolerans]|uniref:Substrate-binding domain-containing protein n=1 Tax=Shewanella psychropiezotolerans TaxID=2593655 RepID=A0ABX5X5P6_9GAMM|nr:substrate-binding domain-containing protein [Shewanella sp. YLB-07]QDO86681.1 substrate-binding domain-containing protein [Shewanella psychropiezotolerans]